VGLRTLRTFSLLLLVLSLTYSYAILMTPYWEVLLRVSASLISILFSLAIVWITMAVNEKEYREVEILERGAEEVLKRCLEELERRDQ
jgi:uncharacterized membrane protein